MTSKAPAGNVDADINSIGVGGFTLDHLDLANKLSIDLPALSELLSSAETLVAWADGINWTGESNTKEFMDGLRSRIDAVCRHLSDASALLSPDPEPEAMAEARRVIGELRCNSHDVPWSRDLGVVSRALQSARDAGRKAGIEDAAKAVRTMLIRFTPIGAANG